MVPPVQAEELARLCARLEGERAKYVDLFENAPDAYVVTTAHGILSEANIAAGRLFGVTARALVGKALIGFGYVSVASMFLGFFAWYGGLGRAGVARASQVQLAQPMLTLGWSALFLGEHIDAFTGLAAVAVLGCVAWTQRARSLPAAASPRTLGGRNQDVVPR